ncbi:MAG TPA: hypothetical protein VFF73_30785 [Planctomycetota bacterium]|nr:hypothetical protein [Planctomycetota bacterium]
MVTEDEKRELLCGLVRRLGLRWADLPGFPRLTIDQALSYVASLAGPRVGERGLLERGHARTTLRGSLSRDERAQFRRELAAVADRPVLDEDLEGSEIDEARSAS